MIQLILLLLGAKPLRRYWKVFVVAAIASLVVGLIFITDQFDAEITIATDLIGVALVVEGVARLLRLAAIGFPNATLPVIKALGFFVLGFMAINIPWDDNIVATIVIGAVLLLDGIFRLASAFFVRSAYWQHSAAIAVLELILTGLIWATYPIPHRNTVPFCIGVALLFAAWNLCQLGLQLRQLSPGASITDLPLFAGPNWHSRGLLYPSQADAVMENHDDPLTVHIWTPIISATAAQPRPIVDRYIAAIDKNGVVSTGHAAMSLPPDLYISLVAEDDVDHSPTEFTHLLRSGAENDTPGKFQPSLAVESAEWKPPDRNIHFHHYNSAALRSFFEIYHQDHTYNLTRRNCSTTVALSLDAALEGVLGTASPWKTILRLLSDPAMWLLTLWRTAAESMTWTPGLVLDYTQTLQQVLEGYQERWFVRLWKTWQDFLSRRRSQIREGHTTRSSIPAIASIVVTATIFGLTYGLSAPLLALSLTQMGYGESFIGANAAMQAIGVLVIAPFLPNLTWRTGPKLPITVALLLAAVALASFPFLPFVWLWFPLRIALGAASETLFVMSETWLSQLSPENARARTMAIYSACVSLGFALGPIILTLVSTQGWLPYVLGGSISLVALLAVAMPWVQAPPFERPSYPNPWRYVALVPVAIGAALVNAALETAGMSFLPLYAMRAGWSEQSATLLLSVLLLGAILLQLPIGWWGDRLNWRKLVIGLGLASVAGALFWPYAFHNQFLAYAILFIWGGLFVGIYTIMMAVVGSKFQGGDLVSVYAVLSVAWGVGALVGPSGAGLAMELSQQGLPIFAAIACGLFTGLAVLFRRRA
ncbi:MAG: MFS transporter [Stenomitos rutilans HA7619-LM2]|jgi:MFS family permease/uncharacterized membrane protein HdeD (DUF308 family)|nr:MFS transporter [Stenomitos rutilans HA7619-LM2]